MKKLFILGLAAISFAACVQEQVVETPQGGAITFENAFIDNATRAAVDPSTTTNTLTAFDVWGFVKEYDGTVFVDQDVTLNGGRWGYEGTQFWAPNQPYYFAALAPMNSAKLGHVLATGEAAKLGLGTLTFENVDGTEDVLYASTNVMSKGLNVPNESVKFQFKHLLSKVKFTFKNGFITNNASVKVTNIKMTAPAKASIDVAQADYSKAWALKNETVTLAFGDVEKLTFGQDAECADERLTIPAANTYTYNITFDVELFMGAQSVYTVSKTSTVTGVELEMGKAYNFAAEINPDNLELDVITFDVIEVEEWYEDGDVPTYVGTTVYADSASELSAAITDATGDVTVVLAEGTYDMPSIGGKDITLVGTKNTIINTHTVNLGEGNLTLEGVTVKAGSYQGFQHSNVVTYNNVTVEGELYCYGEKDIFNNCTFVLNNQYVWAYGSENIEFNNCVFETNGKAILIYNEGDGATNVTVKNCTFNATAGAKAGAIANQNCAAIEIDNYQSSGVGAAHNVIASGNTFSENFSGEWRIKSFVAGNAITVNGTEYTQIAVDGKLMTIDANKNVTVLE